MISPFVLGGNGITLFTGFAKTGVPGAGILAAILLANAMEQTRQSVGVLLPLLIFADCFAVGTYRKHTDWKVVGKVLPPALAGVAVGAWILPRLHGASFDQAMGGLVLFQLCLDLIRVRLGWTELPHHPLYGVVLGGLAGLTTTIGNMAGPLMTLYLLSLGLDKHRFMGSMAWFFLILNCVKVPIFVREEMITVETLETSLLLAPGVVVGALIGRRVFRHIPQTPFKVAAQIFAGLAAFRLLGWLPFV